MKTALTSEAVNAMRSYQSATMPDEAQFYARGEATDGMFGKQVSYTKRAGALCACRVATPDEREAETLAAQNLVADTIIALPHGTAVEMSDRVKVGQEVFEIAGRLSGGSYETAVRLAVKRVTNA